MPSWGCSSRRIRNQSWLSSGKGHEMASIKLMRSVVLLAAMAGSAYAAVLLTPKVITPHSHEAKVGLEGMIPKKFADWHLLENQAQGVISADVQEQLDRYYSEVLSRTY